MCNIDDVIKCREYATHMKSSYGHETRNDQSNRHIERQNLNNLEKYNVELLTHKARRATYNLQQTPISKFADFSKITNKA